MAFRPQPSMKEFLVIRYSFNKGVECLLIQFLSYKGNYTWSMEATFYAIYMFENMDISDF